MSFNLSLWVWVGVAMLVAWVVGAYGRLQRLRDNAQRARASMLKYLVRYGEESVTVEAQGLQRLRESAQAVVSLSEQWGRDHRSTRVPQGLGIALDQLRHEVDTLRHQPEDLAGALLPSEVLRKWEGMMDDVASRRVRYNVHVDELNDAVAQAPASLLARFTGMTEWEKL